MAPRKTSSSTSGSAVTGLGLPSIPKEEIVDKYLNTQGSQMSSIMDGGGGDGSKTDTCTASEDVGELCGIHLSNILKIFCTDCNILVCAECLLFGEHKGHTYLDQVQSRYLFATKFGFTCNLYVSMLFFEGRKFRKLEKSPRSPRYWPVFMKRKIFTESNVPIYSQLPELPWNIWSRKILERW